MNTEPLGDGQQLVGRLADGSVDVVDQDENFRHDCGISVSLLDR
jgi:hypothetical protein